MIRFDSEPETTVAQPLRLDRPGLPHAPSYWAANGGGDLPAEELSGRRETSVAIIGAGLTGLSCAYHLAREHGVQATVLEANRIGWGASGRNGGFAMICVGKDEYAETLSKYDRQEAGKHFAVGLDAVKTVEEIVQDNELEVDRSTDGWIAIAHKPSRMDELRATQKLLKDSFGYNTELVDSDTLRNKYIASTEAHGGIIYPNGFGLNPMKYTRGLSRSAARLGTTIYTSSPVLSWTKQGSKHILRTPKGSLVADTVLIATAGYTLDSMNTWMSGRVLSAISNIAVTRPLAEAEQLAAGLKTTMMVSDTRRLVFYYRLLPEGRFLFGARGGIQDNAKENQKGYEWLISRMVDMFPNLAGIDIDYFWRGWVCLSRDKNPHIGTTDDPTVHYSIAYIGNGVALASYFGRLAASRIAGRPREPDISLLRTPLPRFELPVLREASLKVAYAYYGLKDRLL